MNDLFIPLRQNNYQNIKIDKVRTRDAVLITFPLLIGSVSQELHRVYSLNAECLFGFGLFYDFESIIRGIYKLDFKLYRLYTSVTKKITQQQHSTLYKAQSFFRHLLQYD